MAGTLQQKVEKKVGCRILAGFGFVVGIYHWPRTEAGKKIATSHLRSASLLFSFSSC
jgi:hypothetical protein